MKQRCYITWSFLLLPRTTLFSCHFRYISRYISRFFDIFPDIFPARADHFPSHVKRFPFIPALLPALHALPLPWSPVSVDMLAVSFGNAVGSCKQYVCMHVCVCVCLWRRKTQGQRVKPVSGGISACQIIPLVGCFSRGIPSGVGLPGASGWRNSNPAPLRFAEKACESGCKLGKPTTTATTNTENKTIQPNVQECICVSR